MNGKKHRGFVIALATVLAAMFFAIDLSLPLGVASSVLYVVSVLVSLWSPKRHDIILAAMACSALTILGYHSSPDGGESWKVISNRCLAIFAIWNVGMLGYSLRYRSDEEIDTAIAALKVQKQALDAHAIVSITDVWGNITYANDKFCEISGYTREELLGQNHRLVRSDEHPPELFRDMWLTISQGKVWHGKIKNLAKDGSHYWVDATIVPFKDKNGNIEQYVAMRTDVTLAKETEEKASAMNAQLMKINADLETARVNATLATKAKSDFLANMSHEIRTPMTAILGYSENLLEDGLSELETTDAIETIRNNGEYLLTIINDILDMSKIEADKMEVEHVPCHVHSIIADVVSLMKVRADEKEIALNTEIIGSIPETIHSDPTRLKQILINIVGNAIKFTDEGGIRLITRFVPGTEETESPTKPRLQFDIIDTGVGMTKEQASNLFQAFAQADNTMTRKFGGTGLGLTISKKFAEMLGGDLFIVDSQPGHGTQFRACIETGPIDGVRMIEQWMDTLPTEPIQPSVQLNNKPLDCRILLAEDGPDNQRLISFILKKAGAEVTVAENGQIAFDLAMAAENGGKPFDVILMDMQMPVLDGYKATMALREKNYERPIIALTAHAMAKDKEKCMNSGCDDFASKPVDRQKLIEMIREHLEPAGAACTALV